MSKASRRSGDVRRAVAYLRVSTDRERQDLGTEAQRACIREWARRNDADVLAWFSEEVSGGAPLHKRPVLLEAIASLRKLEAGALVFQRLDRFSRDPFTAALADLEVQKQGARAIFADGMGNGDDPGNQLVRDVGLAAARFERAVIAARTKAALAVKRARGECTGTPPYGWRIGPDGRRLEKDPHEQHILQRVRSLHSDGLSYRAIGAEATRLGLRSRTGKPFTLQAIYNMVAGK